MFSLIKKINSLLKWFEKDLASLEKKSNQALVVFKNTLEDLENVNKKIDEKIALADTQIESLNSVKERLTKNKEANVKVSSKIAEFLA